jgi:hypothetical protein
MMQYSGDLAHIRRAELLREAERVSLVSRTLRERKAISRERISRRDLRPLRQVQVLAAALLTSLRP